MKVAEVWRYPVKSMLGEKLDQAEVEPGGLSTPDRFPRWRAELHRSDPNVDRHQRWLGRPVLADDAPILASRKEKKQW